MKHLRCFCANFLKVNSPPADWIGELCGFVLDNYRVTCKRALSLAESLIRV